jgi:hypothetical protein
MTFKILPGLLHEVAATSPPIKTRGACLTHQTPGRRYFALGSGTAASLHDLAPSEFAMNLALQKHAA